MATLSHDPETGESIQEPPFIKMYVKDLCTVKGLTAPMNKMFYFMLCNMNYENIISYGKSSKNLFLVESGMANSTFDNNVSKLIKSGLIERISKGEFRANKKYVSRKSWEGVQKIEWTTTYSSSGITEKVTYIKD